MEEDVSRELLAARQDNQRLRDDIERLEADKRGAEANAARSQAIAEAANEELQSFVYAVSHDVKEVLRSVASYSQLIIRKLPDQPDIAEYGGYVSGGVSTAVAILDRMNDFARVDPNPAMTNVHLQVVVQMLGLKLQAMLQQSGAKLTCDHLPVITANEAQITRLLEQMIDNAVKYRSTEQPMIHISAAEEDDGVTICVQDNGQGIEPQYQELIFKPFKRLHGKNIPGVGLGLAIAKKIASAHGGSIGVESTGTSGCTFKIFLPF